MLLHRKKCHGMARGSVSTVRSTARPARCASPPLRQSKLARFKPEIARACHSITVGSCHMIVFQHPKICLRARSFCIALAGVNHRPPGASPEVMTTAVTAPLERQFGEMPGDAGSLTASQGGNRCALPIKSATRICLVASRQFVRVVPELGMTIELARLLAQKGLMLVPAVGADEFEGFQYVLQADRHGDPRRWGFLYVTV
jgi:hypothetical protein